MEKKFGKLAGIMIFGGLLISTLAGGKTKLVEPVYDFGVLEEKDGNVTGVAHIVNLGPDTTYIRDVRPSCGCTGAKFNTDPIAPGDTSVVSFTYNPIGRPGTISKTVKIYIGDQDERHIVRLTGRVVGTPESLRSRYPVEMGRLMLSDTIIKFGDIESGSGRHAFVRVVNASIDTIPYRVEYDTPVLKAEASPAHLLPGDLSTIGIYLNTKFTDTVGAVEYPIVVKEPRDTVGVVVKVKANILPPPSKEERQDASAS